MPFVRLLEMPYCLSDHTYRRYRLEQAWPLIFQLSLNFSLFHHFQSVLIHMPVGIHRIVPLDIVRL